MVYFKQGLKHAAGEDVLCGPRCYLGIFNIYVAKCLEGHTRVPGSRMWPSEPGLRTTGLHELDTQSKPGRRGCHSRELQDQLFTFWRRFGTARIFSTAFSMHSIGFLLRETEQEWKLVLKIPRFYSMSLYKPKAVYGASERQYTAAGGDVQVPRGGFTCDGRRSPMRLIHGLVKLTQFCVSFIALWSQNGSFQALQICQFSNRSLFRSLPMVMNLE